MPRGYRCIIFAAVGWLIAAASPEQGNSSAQQTDEARTVTNALQRIDATLQETDEPDVTTAPCREGQDNSRSDLCAQWTSAKAAESTADAAWVFGAIGSVIGLLTLAAASAAAKFARDAAIHTEKGAYEAERAAVAAEDALAETRAATALQMRPYVTFTEAADNDCRPFSRDSKLYYVIKNFGQIPASQVAFDFGEQFLTEPIGDAEITFTKWGSYGLLAPGDRRQDTIHARDFPLADIARIAEGKEKFFVRLRITYSWTGGIDSHDLTWVLDEPVTNEWSVVDYRRRYHQP